MSSWLKSKLKAAESLLNTIDQTAATSSGQSSKKNELSTGNGVIEKGNVIKSAKNSSLELLDGKFGVPTGKPPLKMPRKVLTSKAQKAEIAMEDWTELLGVSEIRTKNDPSGKIPVVKKVHMQMKSQSLKEDSELSLAVSQSKTYEFTELSRNDKFKSSSTGFSGGRVNLSKTVNDEQRKISKYSKNSPSSSAATALAAARSFRIESQKERNAAIGKKTGEEFFLETRSENKEEKRQSEESAVVPENDDRNSQVASFSVETQQDATKTESMLKSSNKFEVYLATSGNEFDELIDQAEPVVLSVASNFEQNEESVVLGAERMNENFDNAGQDTVMNLGPILPENNIPEGSPPSDLETEVTANTKEEMTKSKEEFMDEGEEREKVNNSSRGILELVTSYSSSSDSSSDSELEEEEENKAVEKEAEMKREKEMAAIMAAKAAKEKFAVLTVKEALRERLSLKAKLQAEKESLSQEVKDAHCTRDAQIKEIRTELYSVVQSLQEEKEAHLKDTIQGQIHEASLEAESSSVAQELAMAQRELEEVSGAATECKDKLELAKSEVGELERKISGTMARIEVSLSSREEFHMGDGKEEASEAIFELRQLGDRAERAGLRVEWVEGELEKARSEVEQPSGMEVELELRLEQVIDLLIQRQQQVEAMATERAATLLRLEAAMAALKDARGGVGGSVGKGGRMRVGVREKIAEEEEDLEIGLSRAYALNRIRKQSVLEKDFGWGGGRVNSALTQMADLAWGLDSLVIGGAGYIRTNSTIRRIVWIYLLFLHVWVVFVWFVHSSAPPLIEPSLM